jgi:hypothetical protein
MSASLRALLSGILDYAGLFPPARLALEPAIRNYARYCREPEGWMLGCFVCPAARLGELSPLVGEHFGSGPPLALAVLGRGGNTEAEFREGLTADLQALAAFTERHGDRVSLEMIELRLPGDVLNPTRTDALKALLAPIRGDLTMWSVRTKQPKALKDYYEISLAGDWRATLASVLPLLSGGFKLRCGGLEATSFPTSEQVAAVLAACARKNVPFKATAGLHHPLRHFDATVHTSMHGFLNVFGAAVLAYTLRLGEEQVLRIIEDEDPEDFVFTEDEFRWKDLSVTVDAITEARHPRVGSFGSCSFDEPRDDLRALGLL